MTAPYIFVTRGDVTRIRADVVIIPTSTAARGTGDTIGAAKSAWGMAGVETALRRAQSHMRTPGDAWGCPLEAETSTSAPRALVFVATVREEVDASSVRDGARAAVLEASRVAEECDRSAPSGWRGADGRRLLIAVGSLGTGRAKGRDLATLARAQLEGISAALRETEKPVDVVIVAWSEDAWACFVHERGELNAHQEPAERAIASAIRSESSVLFVGAGLSRGAGLPDWAGLVEKMRSDERVLVRQRALAQQHVRANGNAERVADDYLDIAEWYAGDDDKHLGLIASTFGSDEVRKRPPTAAHYLLLQLPFRFVVTTNYDPLVENTLTSLRRRSQIVVADQDVARAGQKGQTTVFKIHGSVSDRAEEIVLTRSEYGAFANTHRAKAALLQALHLNHHFFFVGYGLGDPNLNTIRQSVGEMLSGAQRRAWATRLGKTKDVAESETRSDALHWLPCESERDLWIRLDRIAASCAGGARRLLADEDVEQPSELVARARDLGDALVVAVSELASSANPETRQVEAAAQILQSLAGLGWRPKAGSRYVLWAQLAAAADPLAALELWSHALADAADEKQKTEAETQLKEATRALARIA